MLPPLLSVFSAGGAPPEAPAEKLRGAVGLHVRFGELGEGTCVHAMPPGIPLRSQPGGARVEPVVAGARVPSAALRMPVHGPTAGCDTAVGIPPSPAGQIPPHGMGHGTAPTCGGEAPVLAGGFVPLVELVPALLVQHTLVAHALRGSGSGRGERSTPEGVS